MTSDRIQGKLGLSLTLTRILPRRYSHSPSKGPYKMGIVIKTTFIASLGSANILLFQKLTGINDTRIHQILVKLWGRGNSWYTAGLVKIHLVYGIPCRMIPLPILKPPAVLHLHMVSLKLFAKGYVDKKYLDTAMTALRAVVSQIDETGTVQGVSYGTPVFNTLQEYKDIEITPMPYGQSMVLMMLVEGLKHL